MERGHVRLLYVGNLDLSKPGQNVIPEHVSGITLA
jgi:hypothetical protein